MKVWPAKVVNLVIAQRERLGDGAAGGVVVRRFELKDMRRKPTFGFSLVISCRLSERFRSWKKNKQFGSSPVIMTAIFMGVTEKKNRQTANQCAAECLQHRCFLTRNLSWCLDLSMAATSFRFRRYRCSSSRGGKKTEMILSVM